MEMEMVFRSLGIFMMEMVFRSLGIFMEWKWFSEASGSSWKWKWKRNQAIRDWCYPLAHIFRIFTFCKYSKLLVTDAILLRTFSGFLHFVNTPSYEPPRALPELLQTLPKLTQALPEPILGQAWPRGRLDRFWRGSELSSVGPVSKK